MKHGLIDKKFRVLDHGHVVLQDYMSSDEAIAQTARTSYQKGTRKPSDDRTLLRYLLRNRHTTPFEFAQLKFHIRLPIFVERQWARHRTASTNEVSGRYSVLPEEFYAPDEANVCEQSRTNKQGRGDALSLNTARLFHQKTVAHGRKCFSLYHDTLDNDVARETARINLPLGTYTEKCWTVDLHNLMHFLELRMDEHAQWEIRQYAQVIGHQIVAKLFPVTWEAFVDYRLKAVTLTRLEIEALQRYFNGGLTSFLVSDNNREQAEFEEKLTRLGLAGEDQN